MVYFADVILFCCFHTMVYMHCESVVVSFSYVDLIDNFQFFLAFSASPPLFYCSTIVTVLHRRLRKMKQKNPYHSCMTKLFDQAHPHAALPSLFPPMHSPSMILIRRKPLISHNKYYLSGFFAFQLPFCSLMQEALQFN